MTTSDNFDIFPVYKQDVLFRTFDNLIGFSKKYKKKKFIKEEWDSEKGVYVDDRKIAQEKAKDSLKKHLETTEVRNLDYKPLRRAVLEKDTVYSVNEIARFIYKMNPMLGNIAVQGRWGSPKALEDDLRKSKSLREKADKYMVSKKGLKMETKKKNTTYDIFDLAKRIVEKKDHPAIKALIGDTDEATLRRMIAKDPESGKKLNRVLDNIK